MDVMRDDIMRNPDPAHCLKNEMLSITEMVLGTVYMGPQQLNIARY
jgi:hypothetical protein